MQQRQNSPAKQQAKQTTSQQQHANVITQQHVALRQHAGPIPDPQTLAQYNVIQPDFAERIMRMAEKEQEGRHKREDELVGNQHKQHKRDTDTYRIGQYLAAFSVILVVALCIYLASLGNSSQAAIVGTGAIAAVAAVFIVGRSKGKDIAAEQMLKSDSEQ